MRLVPCRSLIVQVQLDLIALLEMAEKPTKCQYFCISYKQVC